MSELDKAMALMAPALGGKGAKGFKPGGGSPGPGRAAEAPDSGTPAPAASAPAPSRKPRAIVRAGEDPETIRELLDFVDEVGHGREVAERLPNPLHLGVVTKTGGTLRGQLRIYSIAAGRVGGVRFKDRADERDNGQRVRNRIALWNRKQGV